MQQLTNWTQSASFPRPADTDLVELGRAHLVAALESSDDAGAAELELVNSAATAPIIDAIFGNSPYLARCAASDPLFFCRLLSDGPDAMMDEAVSFPAPLDNEGVVMQSLRRAKRRVSLVAGLGDISGLWRLTQITGMLSDYADLAIETTVKYLLLHARGHEILGDLDPDDPQPGSGLIILGMGKLGAHELNYSSDIDLIIFYDPEMIDCDQPDGLQQFFVRMSRDLVKILSEPTADGYVFRTDLRLRPDPGSTPTALSVLAAETYYESIGQNWERAAMIKARQVAGDREAGDSFLHRLAPFIWRKNLDFAAIQDVHSIKRQINAHRGGSKITVAGHNVKLGRGGIREIEFFAQTQQLIWGGREPTLRNPGTEDALHGLTAAGQIEPSVRDDLIEAYRFLRKLEHRLQMVEDRQTHDLPDTEEGLSHIALFMGFDDLETFQSELLSTLRTVESHYADLFEDQPSLAAADEIDGNLIFTGSEDDPETMETLRGLGYQTPERIAAAIRSWHHARYRATRSERSRQILTELVPVLAAAFGKTPDPDAAFLKFDEFLAGMPAGIQLFSMLRANPALFDLLAEIMGSAPKLASHLGRHPALLDSVLEADFHEPLPAADILEAELRAQTSGAEVFEDLLEDIHRWTNDRKFQIGVQCLRNRLDWGAAGRSLSDVAEVALRVLQDGVESEFAAKHGRIPGGTMSIVAFGKLGGYEMTPTSDLDIVFVYDFDSSADASDGERPLGPSQYFARYAQRLITAITAPTAEGKLYEVDMRLRPSGNAGPIASTLDAFRQYHDASAWTWENLALSRARAISGTAELQSQISDVICNTLTRKRDTDALLKDVSEMRQRIDTEHGTTHPWEVKYLRGGLVDVEFIIQFLQLKNGNDHPGILATNTRDALNKLAAEGLVSNEDHETLRDALQLWQAIQGILRLTIEGFVGRKEGDFIPEALESTLARAANQDDLPALTVVMSETAANVRAVYSRLVAPLPDSAAAD